MDLGVGTVITFQSREVFAVILTFGLCAASGALNTSPRWRRGLCLGAIVATFFTPWIATASAPLARALCAGGGVLAVFRNLDIYRDQRPWSARQRITHVLCVFDSRRVSCVRPAFVPKDGLRVVGFGALTAATGWAVATLSSSDLTCKSARWLCGAAWAYVSIEALVAVASASSRAMGVALPQLHDSPMRARSVREFWGQRWNLSVQGMLRDHCFRPSARRWGPLRAVVWTFGASALLHFWLTLAAGGVLLAVSMAAYFLVQAMFVVLELRFRQHRWGQPWQHLWSVAAVVLPLPLLLEPLLFVVFG